MRRADWTGSFKKAWAEVDTARTGYIKRKDFAKFFAKLEGVFEVRMYDPAFSVPNLLREAAPDPERYSDKSRIIDCGDRLVDLSKLRYEMSSVDFQKVRARRRQYVRLWTEARMSEEPGRGISFTQMLLMLAHYKLINDEDALRVDELLVRRAKLERVHDLVSLDRVRGLIRTIYWRRRFLAQQEERRARQREAEQRLSHQHPIPAIFVDTDAGSNPVYARDPLGVLPESPTSSEHSHSNSLSHSHSADASFGSTGSAHGHQHSLSHSWDDTLRPLSTGTLGGISRSGTIASRHSHSASVASTALSESEDHSDVLDSMATSVWGDLMREAVDEEDE